MIFEKSCGAVVFDIHNDCPFVVVEYMAKGHVSLPKGHMEEGETEEETAAREILEETNLIVYIDNVFRHEVTYSPKPGVQKTVVFFLATVDNIADLKPQKEEVTEIRLMGINYAIKEMTYDADKEVLHHAASYICWRYYHTTWEGAGGPAFPKLLYREHAVDIHSHIIPGVDDGAQELEEAQDLAFLDREEGMDVVFATPHYGVENGYAPKKELIKHQLDELQDRIYWDQGDCPNALVYLGTEWYCSDDIVERIKNKEAYPMGNSNWYMVEFLEWGNITEPADIMIYRLAKMRLSGINTILAHPERYKAIQQDWNLAKRICDLGVLLQVNAYDLCLNKNLATRNLAQWMAQEHLISFIGSDMHGTRIKEDGKPARKPQMKDGIRWLYENVDEEYANDIVRRNAEKYLGVTKLPVEQNREYIPFPEYVENLEGPELLKIVRAYPKSFLPMVDRQYEYHYLRDRSSRLHKKNLSWGAGVLSGNRPYFAEYWNLHQLGTLRHFLTLYVSSERIEKDGLRDVDLIRVLGLEELAESADGGHLYAEVATYTDHSGKEFFTLRMLIIEEWGKTVINWKGKLFPYRLLHQMNGKEDESDLTGDQDW